MAENNKFSEILGANKHLNFVDRLYNKDKYPSVENKDGTFSTHKMMSANIDNMPLAFPTIIYNPKTSELMELSPEEAIKYAMKNKEYIKFNSDEEANAFADNGYKKAFPPDYFKQLTPQEILEQQIIKAQTNVQ